MHFEKNANLFSRGNNGFSAQKGLDSASPFLKPNPLDFLSRRLFQFRNWCNLQVVEQITF